MMSHFAEVRVPIKRRYSCLRLPARTSKPHCQLKSKAVKMKWSLTAENQCQDIYTSRFPRSSTLSLPCTIRSIVLKAGNSTTGDVQLNAGGRTDEASPILCWQAGGLSWVPSVLPRTAPGRSWKLSDHIAFQLANQITKVWQNIKIK